MDTAVFEISALHHVQFVLACLSQEYANKKMQSHEIQLSNFFCLLFFHFWSHVLVIAQMHKKLFE